MFPDDMVQNANIFCTISNEYQLHLREIEDRETFHKDKFLKMATLFLCMSENFILFIQSYRCPKSVGIILRYDWFVTVLAALSQHKYVMAYHEQIHGFLNKIRYSRYVESLLN